MADKLELWERSQNSKAMGPAMVVIQPDDAAARGIGDLSTTLWYIEGSTEAKRRVVAPI